MNVLSQCNVGIVGACGRGGSFKDVCDAHGGINILAVCDTNEARLHEAATSMGAREEYSDFSEMLDKSELDAVIIATPMHLHATQAVQALERNIHVLSEVTAAISVDECRQLVRSAASSRGIYMMAENYTYIRSNTMIREMVRRGEFGTPYYAEGEYLHELKGLNEITTWRRKWQNGIDGVTYGTHSLGPILQWMPGDRVTRVCSSGSGHHYKDPRGDEYAQDTSVMLCQMQSGGLVKIRVDMISDRPHAMTNYQLQGTDACYESARAPGESNRIWLRSRCDDADSWLSLADLEDEFLPTLWREADDAARRSGHGGTDYLEILDFMATIEGKHSPMIGIHEAMDMTLPGLISQLSISKHNEWMDVPNSRDWVTQNAV